MTTMLKPFACQFCIHLNEAWSCKAFDRIPDRILSGVDWHEDPVRGDGGTVFSPLPGVSPPDRG